MTGFGATISIAAADPGLVDACLARVRGPLGIVERLSGPAHVVLELTHRDGGLSVRRNGRLIFRSPTAGRALDRAAREIELGIARSAPDLLFVHAGAVAVGDAALLVPGRSLSGKSTLVAELVRRGATYLSDEYAVLDQTGLVHPYARPLSLRLSGGVTARQTAEDLGGRNAAGPARVGLIALARYQSGACWRPDALSPGRAVLGVLRHTVAARSRPAAAIDVLARVAARARVLAGRRGEAEVVAPLLLEALGRATSGEPAA